MNHDPQPCHRRRTDVNVEAEMAALRSPGLPKPQFASSYGTPNSQLSCSSPCSKGAASEQDTMWQANLVDVDVEEGQIELVLVPGPKT